MKASIVSTRVRANLIRFAMTFLLGIGFEFIFWSERAEAAGPDVHATQSGSATISGSLTRTWWLTGGSFTQFSVWVPYPGTLTNSGELSQTFNPNPQPGYTLTFSPSNGDAVFYSEEDDWTPGWWVTWAYESPSQFIYEVTVSWQGIVTASSNGISVDPIPESGGPWSITTNNVNVSDSAITVKADQLFTASASLTDYIYNVIQYVSSNVSSVCPGSRTASMTMQTKTGSCEGMTNLCLAMLRHKDIPCGFASGVSLSGNQPYLTATGAGITASAPVGFHGWGVIWWENDWIAFDPTGPSYAIVPPQRLNWTTHVDSDLALMTAHYWGPPGTFQPIGTTFNECVGGAVTASVTSITYTRPEASVLQKINANGPSMSPPPPVSVQDDEFAGGVGRLLAWPNPSSGRFQIAPGAMVYDASGRLLWNGKGKHPNLSSGVYFARTSDGRNGNLVIIR